MKFEGQVVNIAHGSHAADPSAKRQAASPAGQSKLELRERIVATVTAARAQRQRELQQASDRAAAERRDIQEKATRALLLLLSDDVLDSIIAKHAGLGELQAGTIKVTKHGVELIRSGSAGAAHMAGDRLDIKFDGAILQAGQQLKSAEFRDRVRELQAQGIDIEASYDASGQSILITFDYEKALL